jgi:hypothetical protein
VRTTPTALSYSITSSATDSKVGGTAMPNALAARRLRIALNLMACSIGMSPGLVPLRILSMKYGARQGAQRFRVDPRYCY